MKNKLLNYIIVIYSLFCVFTIIGVLLGVFTFGLGLGDIGMLLIQVLSIMVILVINFTKSKFGINSQLTNKIMIFTMFILMIYFLLHLTIFRGSENPW